LGLSAAGCFWCIGLVFWREHSSSATAARFERKWKRRAPSNTAADKENRCKHFIRQYGLLTGQRVVAAMFIPPKTRHLFAGGCWQVLRRCLSRAYWDFWALSLVVMRQGFGLQTGCRKGAFRLSRIKMFVDALWGLMTVVIILGGILSGIFILNLPLSPACGPSSSPCLSTGLQME
jgi:hypothetical protein